MLVGKRMSSPVTSVTPDLPIQDALILMKTRRIRRLPVVQNNKLVGIVSETDLLNASPSQATTLSVWELNYLLSKISVQDVMSKKVFTVNEDTPIEEAACIMADNRIGGLPVVRGLEVVGIITETDLFKIFLEFMGAREAGVRVTATATEKHGVLADLSRLITNAGGNFISLGVFESDSPEERMVTFKVTGLTQEKIQELIAPIILNLIDIRDYDIRS